MRKLFLLLPALVLSLFANAKEIEISSSTSNIIHSTIAASTTSDGDVIVLTDAGPYVNSKANSDDYTKIAKNVTIKAADGIQPVIKFEVPIQARDGKSGKFIGIKFDGSSLQYDHFIYFKDGNDNDLEFEDCEFYNSSKYIVSVPASTKANSLVFKNCKFYNNSTNRGILNQGNIGRLELDGCEVSNFVKEFIHGYSGTSHVDECVVNDCYFHDNSRSSIMFVASTVDGTQTCDQLTVTNSTFANIDASGEYESVIDIRPYGTAATDAIQVLVDHCTFYNNTVKNSDHANIRTAYLSDVTVSNCIFYYPSEYATRATYCTGGGNINNCLTYNYTAEGTKGHAYGATVNAASIVADPLFDDLANNKYTFAGDWTTTPMSLSPARGAATDGSDLGDPRWYTAETLPSTNFASPYPFVGAKALITGNIWYDGTNDYLYYNDKSECGTATWKINATRACALQATLNMNAGTSTDHQFKVEVLDADGNSIAQTQEPSSTSAGENIELPNPLSIPAAGNYTIKLYNLKSWSSAKINSITLAYKGGAIQNLPCELALEDAIHSALVFVNGEGEMQFSDETDPQGSQVSAQYAKWNMNVAKEGFYKFATHVKSDNGQSYTVNIYNSDETILKGTASLPEEGNYGYERTFATDLIYLEASNYVLKIQNNTNYSHGRVIDIKATYEGGALVNLPNAAIPFEDAILNGATRDGDGIHFGAVDRYAEWNVAATAGLYTFTFNVVGSNYGHYQLTIIDSESNTIYDNYKGQSASGSVTHSSIYLDGNYTIRVANTNPGADGYITSIAATAASDIFVLDENTTEDGSVAAKDGAHWKLMLRRTFSAGKYYSICIPIDSYDSELTNIFGTGYELWAMESAIQNGEEISLNFTQITDGSFVAGKPYLIKPTQNVENPTFSSHTIHNYTSNNVQSFAAADFIGSFYKTVIPAGESNLYLQNNNLYYSETNNTPIKGTRAWIQLKQSGSLAPARARIVLLNQVVTNIQLAEPEENKAIKTIENGQLIIIRDGVRYNAMGVVMK